MAVLPSDLWGRSLMGLDASDAKRTVALWEWFSQVELVAGTRFHLKLHRADKTG